MKKLILFDIDGTILNFRHGIAKELFASMLEELFNRPVPEEAIPYFHGMTDLQIIRTIAENIGITYSEVEPIIPGIWQKMLAMFQEHSKEENITILPGIPELIEQLNKDKNISLALVTGNFMENAYLKLSVSGLDKYFPTGAFGCDSADRNALPPIAIQRVNSSYNGEVFNNTNSIIIGDTFRDIECAHVNRIKVMAVATGGFTIDELNAHKPDKVIRDFSDLDQSINDIYSLFDLN